MGAGTEAVRVAQLTSVHTPDDPRISLKECPTLAAAGFDVTLVATGIPTAPSPMVRFVAVRPSRSRISRMLIGPARVFRAARRTGARVFHFHDPELMGVAIALKLLGGQVIYDVHEDLPRQIAYKTYLPRLVRRPIASFAAIVEGIVARLVDGVVAATPRIAERFPDDRTVVVQNFPLIEEFSEREPRPYADRLDEIVYVGRITAAVGALVMADAAAIVAGRRDIAFTVAGPDPYGIAEEIQRRARPATAQMPGWIDRPTVTDLLDRAKVGLVLFQPEGNYVEAYPTKLFEYMAAGLPVVASDFPLWREIVDGAGCGYLVDPHDPVAIADAIEAILDDPAGAAEMGRRGREAVFDRYRWDPEGARLVGFYERLLQRR